MKPITLKIILADEHRLFIDSLKMVIEKLNPRFKVIATSQDAQETLRMAIKEKPDIILLDINLLGIKSQDIFKSIRSKSPNTRIIVLTSNNEYRCMEESIKNGVSAYFMKNIALSELVAMLPFINEKTIVFSRELTEIIFRHSAGTLKTKKRKSDFQLSEFSANEKKLLSLVIQGLTNHEIADKMYLAEQTVKNSISKIYMKMGVHNRTQVIKKGKLLFSL